MASGGAGQRFTFTRAPGLKAVAGEVPASSRAREDCRILTVRTTYPEETGPARPGADAGKASPSEYLRYATSTIKRNLGCPGNHLRRVKRVEFSSLRSRLLSAREVNGWNPSGCGRCLATHGVFWF